MHTHAVGITLTNVFGYYVSRHKSIKFNVKNFIRKFTQRAIAQFFVNHYVRGLYYSTLEQLVNEFSSQML